MVVETEVVMAQQVAMEMDGWERADRVEDSLIWAEVGSQLEAME